MRNKRQNIITTNKEIYSKLNMLHFMKEVVLTDVKGFHIKKIAKNINRNGKVLDIEHINGKYIVLKKRGHFNFNIYLK